MKSEKKTRGLKKLWAYLHAYRYKECVSCYHRVWFFIYYIFHIFCFFTCFYPRTQLSLDCLWAVFIYLLSIHITFLLIPFPIFNQNKHVFYIRNCFSVCVIDFSPIKMDSFSHFFRILLLNLYLICAFLSESPSIQCGFCTLLVSIYICILHI